MTPESIRQRVHSYRTQPTTLVSLVAFGVVLALSMYVVFGDQKRPDLPAPVVRSTEAHVTHAIPTVGDVGRIGAPATACFELQDYRRVRELAGSDRAAADTYAAQACGQFEAGLQVIAAKVSGSDNAVCAQQVGLPQCFWISGEAFGKEPARRGGE